MDRRLLYTGLALGVVVAISLMLVRIEPEPEELLESREPVSDVEIEEDRELEEEPEYAYLLREHQGRIAVFVPGEEEPEMVFDVPVRLLPDYDQVLMAEGIPARDYNHLVTLIEDYIS